jgi:hypothetical protein
MTTPTPIEEVKMKYPRLPIEEDKRRKLTMEQIDEMISLHDSGMSYRKIGAMFEVSKTLVRYHCLSGIERDKLNHKRYELLKLQEKRDENFKEKRKEEKLQWQKDSLKRSEAKKKYKGKMTYKSKKKRYHTDEEFKTKTKKQAMETIKLKTQHNYTCKEFKPNK